MSAPQTLVQAAFNRLSARVGSGLADAAAGLAVIAQDAPETLRREWELFREEVEQEAERLERPDSGDPRADQVPSQPAAPAPDPQDQIDALRAQVARVARRLEGQG
jgi:hypothetical protein